MAFPDRAAVALIGDGGFSTNPSVIATAMEAELPVVWQGPRRGLSSAVAIVSGSGMKTCPRALLRPLRDWKHRTSWNHRIDWMPAHCSAAVPPPGQRWECRASAEPRYRAFVEPRPCDCQVPSCCDRQPRWTDRFAGRSSIAHRSSGRHRAPLRHSRRR